jgi:hypothetical protein
MAPASLANATIRRRNRQARDGQWPTILVIDHRGVIRDRDCIREQLTNVVVRLLQEQADDPEAKALLEAHPVPQIPTLMCAQEAAAEKEGRQPD